jgi:GntR family transcriptional regulator, rspAB operon transcriptional repressor
VVHNTRVRLSDQAYEQAKHLIISGALEPGSLLVERDLMAQLGTGRTPLREALQRLERDHLVSVVPGGGYLVTSITTDGVQHIYELRRPIEALSARLAAQRARPRDRDLLQLFIREAELAGDDKDAFWHLSMDGRFHDLIAAATGNPYLRATASQLFSLTQRILMAARSTIPTVQDELPFYRELTDLIAAHDAERAEEVMLGHLFSVGSLTEGIRLD